MQLTRFADYSLRALIYLAQREGLNTTISEIASAHRISKSHLMKVIHNLAKQGYVRTTRGKGGGISLAHSPGEILIGKVVVMASVHVPIAHDMATGWHFLPWAPAGRILTAARRVGLSNSCGQSQAGEPEAAAYCHRRCASCD